MQAHMRALLHRENDFTIAFINAAIRNYKS